MPIDVSSSAKRIVEAIEVKLRESLPGYEAQKRMEPSVRADLLGNTLPNQATRKSAVLILLYPADFGLNFVLIKRQTYDGPHSGQVSLPGGKFDDTDQTLDGTALRETYEEVGIEPGQVRLLGRLTELYIPVSNMVVQPFVGFTPQKPVFTPNLQEVEYIVKVPLTDLLAEANKSVRVISSHGRAITAPHYNLNNEIIWGATAMILSEFEEVVRMSL